jgi:hypothetical protein
MIAWSQLKDGPLLARLPDVPLRVVADRGSSRHAFREHIWSIGARPAAPAKRNEALVVCPDWASISRRLAEKLWVRLKEWRAVATRHEETATSVLGCSASLSYSAGASADVLGPLHLSILRKKSPSTTHG